MSTTYIFLLLLILAAVFLACRKRSPASSKANHPAETTITQDWRLARWHAIVRQLSILRPQYWRLVATTAEQHREHRIIKEQLRIADWSISYYELLRDNPQHNNATIPGEKEWALTSAELAAQFAGKRIEQFRLLPRLSAIGSPRNIQRP